jgi:riboflavin kinase / FMN adenylyltransferase
MIGDKIMQVQELNFPQQMNIINQKPLVLAAGFFDGIHLGHQNVIKTAIRLAKTKQLPAGVLTFDRHPATVFGTNKSQEYQYLSLPERKLELLQKLGVDIVYIAKFNVEFSQLTPAKFVQDFLQQLNLDTLVAGFDWTFGPKNIANMQHLRTLARHKFKVVEIPKLQFAEHKISSTNIKKYLANQQIEQANLLLGYNYQNSGLVVHGRAVGRQLGFPTANLDISANQLLPTFGVYITRVQSGQKWYPAMTQIGRNLTFNHGQNPITVEANILNFNQDIYGQELKIEWLQYIREEIAFANELQLIDQLKSDQQVTQNYFEKK